MPIPSNYQVTSRQKQAARTAVAVALSQVGKPYVVAGSGPGGFDCSGLTWYAYAAAGIALPRTATEQFAAVPRVPLTDLQPGDLLFFYPGVTHVGMYLGNGLMVDSPHVGTFVRVEPFAPWFGPVMGVGRPS
jgi:cell wall-associated NlpC family hydrolase